jgi:crotonobetainyl-CoA:carnitine CoA-transferase CaiB-like acyl-CoA transferase
MAPLAGTRVVSLAINLPGPRAAQRLSAFGAGVTAVEPPDGDPVATDYPDLYRQLRRDQQVVTLDLKSVDGKARLLQLLADADLLITSSRPHTLAKLGLDWHKLHPHFPRLCGVAIVGYAPPDEDRPGHDLNYQASAGLLAPPQLPRILIADCAGAERAVSAALALLLVRERTGAAGHTIVSLADAAADYADSLRVGATVPGGPLNGGLAQYGLYATHAGWITLAALEAVFIQRLKKALDLPEIDKKSLEARFLTRSAKEWEDWGRQHDIPIAVVANLEE